MSWSHREAIGGGRRLRLGVAGPSRSGKTYSSLCIATGIASKLGGKIFLIDTDNEFSLDYATDFKFEIVDFQPPFTSERYQAAVEYCVAQGAGVIIIDHMTHEQTGPGGVLERQIQIQGELAKKWKTTEEKTKPTSWAEAKAPHGKFVSFVTRIKQPMIFNFRAKDKLKIATVGGKTEWTHLGYTPICCEQFDFEMSAMLILPPNSDGKPDSGLSEIRRPLRPIVRLDEQIDVALGVRLAVWVVGADQRAPAPAATDKSPATAPPDEPGPSDGPPDPLLVRAREFAETGKEGYAKFWDGLSDEDKQKIGRERHQQFNRIAKAAV